MNASGNSRQGQAETGGSGSARQSVEAQSLSQIGVTVAMGLVSLAAAAGLFAEGRIGGITALIGGLSGFIFLFSVHGLMRHYKRTLELEPRINTVEKSVSEYTDKFQQIEVLAQQVADIQLHLKLAPKDRPQQTASTTGNDEPAGVLKEVANLEGEIRGLRTELEQSNKDQQNRLDSELQVLQTLIKQLAERFASADGKSLISPVPQRKREALTANKANSNTREAEPPVARETVVPEHFIEEDAEEELPFEEVEQPEQYNPAHAGTDMLEIVRESIEDNRVELYLQPVMSLPDKTVRYYEALTRLSSPTGELYLPQNYIDVAEQAGIMPFIDNIMLFRAVQVIRRLSEQESPRGVFCNISPFSLLDPEFFPEFIEFMGENKSLAKHLVFEFSQSMIKTAGTLEREGMKALAELGFHFSLDQVTDLNIDFNDLQEMGFRFLKIDVRIFLHGMADAGAQIHAADMTGYLDRYDIDLIVEKVEDDRSFASLVEYGVELGQGYFFSEPRPVRPEIFGGTMTQAA